MAAIIGAIFIKFGRAPTTLRMLSIAFEERAVMLLTTGNHSHVVRFGFGFALTYGFQQVNKILQ